jgi:uncharacterized membrane-anchored protein
VIPARFRLPLFVLLCAAQLFVAGSVIFHKERVLTGGEVFRFRTAPVDPNDIVRGRYVALRFEINHGPVAPDSGLVAGEPGYAVLDTDDEGFATVVEVVAVPPEHRDYLTVKIEDAGTVNATFGFPIDRFYMPEELAPIAEQKYAEAQRAGRGTWAEIRVRHGEVAIEQLYIDGVPVGAAARQP